MGKRFEGTNPSVIGMLSGFQLMGLEELIGVPGENTAFGEPLSWKADCLEFHTIPGRFSAEEIQTLYREAGLGV